MRNTEPKGSWIVPVMFAGVAVITVVMGYHLSYTHPVAAAIGVLLLTAALAGWFLTLRRNGNLATERTMRFLVVVMLVVAFGGQYLVRNW